MGGSRASRHLVIFARRPRLGVGKRRLAADIGDLAAWRFQRAALASLRRELAKDPRWTLWLAVTPDRPSAWTGATPAIGQGRGDLGQRLTHVLRGLPPGPIVILGSDAPQVRRSDVARAFMALGANDAVFGPAVDGGYWLVGLSRRQRQRPPFAAVRWSSQHALADTVANLPAAKIRYLRRLEDVDDGASLARLRSGAVRPAVAV